MSRLNPSTTVHITTVLASEDIEEEGVSDIIESLASVLLGELGNITKSSQVGLNCLLSTITILSTRV